MKGCNVESKIQLGLFFLKQNNFRLSKIRTPLRMYECESTQKRLISSKIFTSFSAVFQVRQNENGTFEQLEQSVKNFFTQSALSK